MTSMDDDASVTPSQRLDQADEHLRRARNDLVDVRPEVAALLDDALDDVEEALDRFRATQRRLDADRDALFDALGDADCRALLDATDQPRTARELVDRCRIPRSTVYRKLDRLTDVGLLVETVRVSSDGNHPTAYVRRVDQLWIPADETRVPRVALSSRGPREDSGRLPDAAIVPLSADSAKRNGTGADRSTPALNPLGTETADGSR